MGFQVTFSCQAFPKPENKSVVPAICWTMDSVSVFMQIQEFHQSSS